MLRLVELCLTLCVLVVDTLTTRSAGLAEELQLIPGGNGKKNNTFVLTVLRKESWISLEIGL